MQQTQITGVTDPTCPRAAEDPMATLSAKLLLSSVLIAATAQAQGVSFIASRDFDVGSSPASVARVDFTGDGVLDFAVANFRSSNVSVVLGNGDGTFQVARNFGAGSLPASV